MDVDKVLLWLVTDASTQEIERVQYACRRLLQPGQERTLSERIDSELESRRPCHDEDNYDDCSPDPPACLSELEEELDFIQFRIQRYYHGTA